MLDFRPQIGYNNNVKVMGFFRLTKILKAEHSGSRINPVTLTQSEPPFYLRENMLKYCECGCGELTLTYTHTNKQRGHKKGEFRRFMNGHSHKGRHLSDETKRKMSKNRKGMLGKHHSEETKKKISKILTGKHHSEETKRKMSISRMGEKNSKWNGGRKALYQRRKTNVKEILNRRISKGIRDSLKKGIKNGRRWESFVDYNAEILKKRLEQTIPEGYSWTDFLNGKLHIDHIIPISVFNFSLPEHQDFFRCWTLSNLRLLPAKENNKKYNKLEKTFQPALAL